MLRWALEVRMATGPKCLPCRGYLMADQSMGTTLRRAALAVTLGWIIALSPTQEEFEARIAEGVETQRQSREATRRLIDVYESFSRVEGEKKPERLKLAIERVKLLRQQIAPRDMVIPVIRIEGYDRP